MASAIKDPRSGAAKYSPIFDRHGRAAMVGLLGTTLVGLAASLPGAPFAFKVPGAWFFGTPALANGSGIAHASGFALFLELACGFAGIVLLCRAWLRIIRSLARESERQLRYLARILALWSVPLLVAPPMFSNDIYSYAAQGEMVSRHISPYLYGPGVLGATPFSSLAQGVWINTPSPYGPLFSGLDGGIVQLAGHRVLLSVVLLRLLAVVGVALMAIYLPSLARSYGRDPSIAFSLGILNPLVLLFLLGSGHNDSLMVGLLLAGLSIARRGHFTLGIVLCALAGAIKFPGLIGVFAIAWTAPGAAISTWRRCLTLVTASVIGAATLEGLSALFGVGWGWLHTLDASDTVTSWVTPADLVAKVVPGISRVTRVDVSAASFLDVAHVVGPVLAIAISLWALRHLPTMGLPRVMGLSLLAVVLLGPIVQPWYLVWAIAVLAITAGPRTTAAIALTTVSVSLVGAVGLGQLTGELASLGVLYQVLFILTLATTIIVPIRELPRNDSPPMVTEYARHWWPTSSWQLRRA